MNRPEQQLLVTLEEIGDIPALEAAWRDMERRGDHSFFTSWAWLGCLLNELPPEVRPRALMVRSGGDLVGLGLLTYCRHRRNRIVRSRGLYLNETGDRRYDQLTMEYNGLIADRQMPEPVIEAALRWLAGRSGGWNELYLSGIVPAQSDAVKRLAADIGLRVWVKSSKRCDFVDLRKVRDQGGEFLDTLSRNTRYQIRRSIRRYATDGEPGIEVAATVADALGFFEGLKQLHQRYWTRRGHPGAFTNGFFERFHTALIKRCFDRGEVQLCRASAAGRDIGYLYNFVADGRVYAYQSGFAYDEDPKLKPGLVTHFLAIEHNLAAGAEVYDFMAGEGQHKRSLGNARMDLDWLVLQRPGPALILEHALRRLKRKFASD